MIIIIMIKFFEKSKFPIPIKKNPKLKISIIDSFEINKFHLYIILFFNIIFIIKIFLIDSVKIN